MLSDLQETFAGYPTEPKVTLEGLVKHAEKHGLDTEARSVRQGAKVWEEKTYSRYSSFRHDSLVEVGRAFLPREHYVALTTRLGYPQFRDQAKEDWNSSRSDQAV